MRRSAVIGLVALVGLVVGCKIAEPMKERTENLTAKVETVYEDSLRKEREKLAKFRSWEEGTIRWSKENRAYAIVIDKKDRRLDLYHKGGLVYVCRAGLGLNPEGNKLYEWDYRTPEGRYRIAWKKRKTPYGIAYVLNYPTKEDSLRFVEAKRAGKIPRNAKLGKEIEIHGENKEGKGSETNWTWGCPALDMKDIRKIDSKIGPKIKREVQVTIIGYD